MYKHMGVAVLLAVSTQALADRAPTADDLLFKRTASSRARVGLSVDASALLGLGFSVSMPVRGGSSVRAAYHSYSYETERDDGGGNYDAELKLRNYGLFTDYFGGGSFRVTAGVVSNGNEVRLAGKPVAASEFEVGDCRYVSDATVPLQIDGRADFKRLAPYLGIGWGGNMHAAPGFYMTADIGVMFSGAPKSGLGARGKAKVAADGAQNDGACGVDNADIADASTDPLVQQQLRQAEAEFNKEAKDYKFWPNLSIGLGWRF